VKKETKNDLNDLILDKTDGVGKVKKEI